MLSVAVRGDDGDLRAGLYGWTWGGCGYIGRTPGYPHGTTTSDVGADDEVRDQDSLPGRWELGHR